MNWDGIDTMVPEGIRTKKGEIISCDVVVFATGYETVRVGMPLNLFDTDWLPAFIRWIFFSSIAGPIRRNTDLSLEVAMD